MTALNCSQVFINSYDILLPLILLTTFLTNKRTLTCNAVTCNSPGWCVGKKWKQYFEEHFSIYKVGRKFNQKQTSVPVFQEDIISLVYEKLTCPYSPFPL